MAITIVPAVNVSAWHVLSGDSPCTRYVVVEVTNQTDREAELNYGPERQQQATTVQPKETCRSNELLFLFKKTPFYPENW